MARIPGPWETDGDGGINAGMRMIAQVFSDDHAEVWDTSRFIAAAPDMEKALKAIIAADERGQGLPFKEAMAAGVAALAKARGEEER